MIPTIEIDGNRIGIPILGSSLKCWLEWGENDCAEDFFKKCKCIGVWCKCYVWTLNEGNEDGTFRICVYEVTCSQTEKEFYLIAYDSIDEFDDMKNCVCVPHNRLNLLIFYRDYLVPFADKNFFHG
jgi:hypothetical protein